MSILPSILADSTGKSEISFLYMTALHFKNFIPIVDLFAGPGGLGEGFSSLRGDPFRITVSAEMDGSAQSTLRLRAYYRLLKRRGSDALRPYYRFCNGEAALPYDDSSLSAWHEAGEEALRLTLGNVDDNGRLDYAIKKNNLEQGSPWVLIGGPPCQAYSLVGRSRNRGKDDYKAEEDHRHFLYREYLRIIRQYKPAVFVMENVKGILSCSVGGQQIFQTILRDLADPGLPTGGAKSRTGYRIHSLSCSTYFERSMSPSDINPRDFIVRAEEYGVPQARHRVILLGVREDLDIGPQQLKQADRYATVSDAIGALPALRSRLSKEPDSSELWTNTVNTFRIDLKNAAALTHDMREVMTVLEEYSGRPPHLNCGSLRLKKESIAPGANSALDEWYDDRRLTVWLNHETRSHMSSDLCRYTYAAAFAKAKRRSPAGHKEFTLLDALRPKHANWETGKFKDRFKVQLAEMPATTVTSHISKDGHYFIHPDPAQCRSLTVREAARLQTFPDNYFFQGNRTQQYHQVGNAVPPLLAQQIAKVVNGIVDANYRDFRTA
jgi:DNA (cytosine-5)-methyltransferase 1